jgi:hypothetical protein
LFGLLGAYLVFSGELKTNALRAAPTDRLSPTDKAFWLLHPLGLIYPLVEKVEILCYV